MTVLRWAARLASLLLAGTFVYIVIGELAVPHSAPPARLREWVGIGLLSLACLAPLAAWRWTWQAATVSLASLVGFVVVAQLRNAGIAIIIGMPALLFLLDWMVRRSIARRQSQGIL
jgi:hypothetical protein